MAESTGISWCDATFNPWVGCSKVSPGCAHCYAETLVTGSGPRQLNRPGTWGEDGVRERTSASTWGKPKRWNRLAAEGLLPTGDPNLDGHRPRVFCASLADVFEPRPELLPWRRDLFALIEATPNLDWLLLTKRPEEARDWIARWCVRWNTERLGPSDPVLRDLLPNVWLGVSVENARHTWRADVLREIPAAVRFISAEPLLGSLFQAPSASGGHAALRGGSPDQRVGAEREALTEASPARGVSIDSSEPIPREPSREKTSASADLDVPGAGATGLGESPERGPDTRGRAPLDLTGIDWIIVGGESQKGARRLDLDWAIELLDACRESGSAFHMKQMGAVLGREVGGGSHGGDARYFPATLRIQEFPSSVLAAA